MRSYNRINNYTVRPQLDFKKIQGMEIADDAVLDLGKIKTSRNTIIDEERIIDAIERKDLKYLRQVSRDFYDLSGIYRRLCQYMAYLPTYDWLVVPYILQQNKINSEKLLQDFNKTLLLLDNMKIKNTFSNISLKILKNGAFYGIVRETDTSVDIQELPIDYCRSRYKINGVDVIEFNVKYFDDAFKNDKIRLMVLDSMPKEFKKAYIDYKAGRIERDPDDGGYWFLVTPEISMRFIISGSEVPMFISIAPKLLDLDEAQEAEKKKILQELVKIVIQKVPLNKNGDLIFDFEETKTLHNAVVQMLSRAIGVDVLTTLADVEVANLAEKTGANAKDSLAVIERGVYNEAGVSQMLFATNGNLALDKSVANDEAIMFELISQYENWINRYLDYKINKSIAKKYYFKISFPRISIYNYKELSKLYKEQAMLGFSKLLPAIALGQTQSSLLATIYFENEVLDLQEKMKPLQMSTTLSKKDKPNAGTSEGPGRPEKPDDQKSEKTLLNIETAS